METKYTFDMVFDVPPEYRPQTELERRKLHEFIRSKEMAATYTYLKRVETSYLLDTIRQVREVREWAFKMRFNLERCAFPVPPSQAPMIFHFVQTIYIMADEMERDLMKVANLDGQRSLQPTPDSSAEASAGSDAPSASREQERPDEERPSSDQATPPKSRT
jgi:hypothetical protein